MLNQFRNFDADRCDVAELMELAAFGRALRAEFAAHNVEEPEFVDVQLKSLAREIRTRNADQLARTLREKKARLQALKPAEQRREELAAEIADLEKQLATV